MTRLAALSSLMLLICHWGHGQNVVDQEGSGATLPPIQLTETQVTEFLTRFPATTNTAKRSTEAARIAAKLDRHVERFLDGRPWRAFHHTLGISGYESYFAHPDEEFLCLVLALPHLKPATAARTRAFLDSELSRFPPYAVQGFDRSAGRARERYRVPDGLRASGRSRARSALGVYAFWLYCHVVSDADMAASHWPRIVGRMEPLLGADYAFDPTRRGYANDEAETLNGDLAGLLGLWRLARLHGDKPTESRARQRAARLLELRVNLERVNPRFVEKTRTANRTLHTARLARYCSLVPEVAEAVRLHSSSLAADRLKAYREARNAWWLAFGDRFIGGENYTNPPHFVRALFSGAATIEQLPPDRLAGFVDVPWCAGDFYFIEKCALSLWVSSGRAWSSL